MEIICLEAGTEQVFYFHLNTVAYGVLYYSILSKLFYLKRLNPFTRFSNLHCKHFSDRSVSELIVPINNYDRMV